MKFEDWYDKHEKQLGEALSEKTESEWYNKKDGDHIKVEKRKGYYYAAGNSFDLERKSKKEMYDQLKKWGYIKEGVRDGDWVRMSNAQMVKNIPKPKHGVSAFEDRFKELKKKRDIEGLKKLRQVSKDVGHNNIVNMIDKYLKGK